MAKRSKSAGQVSVRKAGGRGRRYSEEARTAALEVLTRRRREGRSYARVAAEVGIHVATLRAWQRAETAMVAAKSPTTFCPVEVISTAVPGRGHVVHGPRGIRVLDLTLDEVAELIRRLS